MRKAEADRMRDLALLLVAQILRAMKTCPLGNLRAAVACMADAVHHFLSWGVRSIGHLACQRVAGRWPRGAPYLTHVTTAGLDPARHARHTARGVGGECGGGASERIIMSPAGYRSADMVRRYIRHRS
jgi:hypothetical protein